MSILRRAREAIFSSCDAVEKLFPLMGIVAWSYLMRSNILLALVLLLAFFGKQSLPAQTPENILPLPGNKLPEQVPAPLPSKESSPQTLFPQPLSAEPKNLPEILKVGGAANLAAAEPTKTDDVLPINLATAMRLTDARPLVIQAALASEMTSSGLLQQAQVLWLPDVYLGSDYQRHDGGAQRTTGDVAINDRNQFLAGGGLKAIFALTDAIYEPLAAQQIYRARNYDVQAAKNDALLDVTDAFFSVQQARGVLAGYEDAVAKGRELVNTVNSLAQGLSRSDRDSASSNDTCRA